MRNTNFDVLKFICSFFVVTIHAKFPGMFGRLFDATARIAVPVFFLLSGFFFYSQIKKRTAWRQVRKILVMILAVILATYIFARVLKPRDVVFDSIFGDINIISLITTAIYNISYIADHLWYLYALLYVLIIAIVLNNLKIQSFMKYLIPVLFIFSLILGTYFRVITGKQIANYCARNAYFMGLPFFYTGYFISQYRDRICACNPVIFLAGSICGLIVSTLERYYIYTSGKANNFDICAGTIIASISLVCLCVCKSSTKQTFLSKVGAFDSPIIYIIHFSLIPIIKQLLLPAPQISPWLVAPITFLISAIISILGRSIFRMIFKKSTNTVTC